MFKTKLSENILIYIISFILFCYPSTSISDIAQIQALTADGNLDEALKLTDQELQIDNNNVTYRFLKGLILTRMDQLELARDVFIEITISNPDLLEPYNNLAVIYASLGDFDKAKDLLEQAINTHPAYATAHENIGDIYAKLASQAYNQALELDQENNTARAKLSLVNDLFSMPEVEQQVMLAESERKLTEQQIILAESERKLAEQQARERELVEQQARERELAEQQTREKQLAEQQARERQLAEQQARERQLAEQQARERQLAEQQARERQLAEQQTRERQLAEQQARQRQIEELQTRQKQIAIPLIKEIVLDWSSAWSRQDVDSYLDLYASDFSPGDGRTLNQWRQYRRERLSAPGSIEVLISDLVVEMLGTDHAKVTFTQVYESNVYSDRVIKTLLLKIEQNKWRITQEQTK